MAALKNIPIILLYVFILGQVQAAEPKAKVDVQVEGENKKFAKTLQWVDKETGEILFDIDDIIRFDWEKQIFELTRSAAMDFMARLGSVGVEGRKFILKDGMMIIYEGTLVTPASSFAFAGAVIRGPLPDDNVRPPLFEIGGGYPEDIARGDSRFSERLKKALEQAIVLSEIDVNTPPAPIEKDSHGWFGKKGGLRVWVDVFPETFRLGEIARMHLHLIGAENPGNEVDFIEVNVNINSNNSKFKHSVRQSFPISQNKRREIYILEMLPWGSARNYYAKAGPAEISMEVSAKTATNSTKIWHLIIKPIPVMILPPTSKLRYGIPIDSSIFRELAVMQQGDQFTTNDNSFTLEEIDEAEDGLGYGSTYAVMSYTFDPYITLIAINKDDKVFSSLPFGDTGYRWPPERIKKRFYFKLSKKNLSHFILLENTRKHYDKIKQKKVFRKTGEQKRTSRGRPKLPPEAELVISEFRQALKQTDWVKTLSYCSKKIKTKAEKYDSTETFLKDVLPIDEIAALSEFQKSGTRTRNKGVISHICEIKLKDPNYRWPLNWNLSVLKEDSIWVVEFPTKALDIWRKHEILKMKVGNDHFLLESEKSRAGFDVRLIALTKEFTIGSPMLFRVEMKNISNETLGYMHTSFMVNNPMVIKDSNGTIVAYIDTSYQTLIWPEFVEPGETVILADNYDVRSQYHITKPGKYTFQFKGAYSIGPSNSVEIDIKPGQLSTLELVVKKLMPVLPKDWTLTRTRTRDITDFDLETDKGIVVNMVGKRGRKGTSEGTVGVFIVINPSQSFLEQTEHEAELWGQSQWGPVYVKSLDTELLWPDYREQIIKVLNIQASEQNSGAQADSGKAKRIENRIASARKLTELGKALIQYAAKHDEKFPLKMEDAAQWGDLNAEELNWLKENIKYLGDGLRTASRVDVPVILAYDKTMLVKEPGAIFLFCDGTVNYYELGRLGISPRDGDKEEDLLKRVISSKYLEKIYKTILANTPEVELEFPESMEILEIYKDSPGLGLDYSWIRQNIEYLGKGKTGLDEPTTPLAYDKTLLKKGKGTLVLFLSRNFSNAVEFKTLEQLEKLGITTDQKPAVQVIGGRYKR